MGKKPQPEGTARWPHIVALVLTLMGFWIHREADQRNREADLVNARIAALEQDCTRRPNE